MPLMSYFTAALTSFSDSISYITHLFSEWRILPVIAMGVEGLHGKDFQNETRRFPRIFV